MNTCPYCEAEEQIEIQEVWPELREFQLAFCCELSQNDWLEFSSQRRGKTGHDCFGNKLVSQ